MAGSKRIQDKSDESFLGSVGKTVSQLICNPQRTLSDQISNADFTVEGSK